MAICKDCKLDLIKNPVIKSNITRFVDDKDRVWNGKLCPDCYKVYNRNRMKSTRQKQNEVQSQTSQ